MYDEIPSLLYVAGALITVLSWTLFAFSKTIRPEGRRAFILCLSVIWILFFASSTLALVPYPLFEAYSGFMDPDVLDFYDQPVIRLLPAVTCGVNLCVSAGCSMVLVASVRSDRPSLRMPTEGQSPLVQKKAESVHVETDRNPLVFPFKTTQSLPFALRPADEPHFFCLKRRKPGSQR